MNSMQNHVIIAGFGVSGRFIAEYLRARAVPFVLVELNSETISTQRAAGLQAVQGDVSDAKVLSEAGVATASVLALAIPDEAAAVRATEVARRMRPGIHILAATRYTSTGLEALQKGADEVIVAEQAVAMEFYRRISAFMSSRGEIDNPAV